MSFSSFGAHLATLRVLRCAVVTLVGCLLLGCVEGGFSPDCPNREDYLDEEGQFEYSAWRSDAEDQGCVTPIGGYEMGQGGSGS